MNFLKRLTSLNHSGQTEHQLPTAVLQKWRCSASYDSEVVNQNLVLRLKFSGENRHLRVAAKRLRQLKKRRHPIKRKTNIQEQLKMSKDKNHNTFSFIERDIDFINSIDGIKLSGTLSIPNSDTKHPCVILISGSGAHTRDQVVLGHKIFRDIAHYLSNNGIAVFRFDDRGVGKSEGIFKTAGLTDFRNDIISAFHHLQKEPNIDKNKIGVLGHSLGGLIAPMVENQLKGQLVFLISLAGPGMIGYELYIKQHELIAQTRGTTSSELQKTNEINRKICDLILQTEDKKKLMQQIRKMSLE